VQVASDDRALRKGTRQRAWRAGIKAWIDGVAVEDQARKQLDNMASMPFIHKHVAIMPDCHWGMGATVGSVIPTKGAIIPAAVGVDIGCGMMALRTSLTASDLPDNLHGVRTAIEKRVPHGRTDNGGENDRGAWGDLTVPAGDRTSSSELKRSSRSTRSSRRPLARAAHLGTLGTGNHFIEVCLDEEERVWVMLHSGSRGIGNRIGSYFIELAKQDMRKWFINLPDEDLAYFPQGTEHFNDYIKAVSWAQGFARTNREMMMATLTALARRFRSRSRLTWRR
jgi:tRNA-splicing ligase RtcB